MTSMLSIADMKQAFLAVLKTGSAGAPVRAALGPALAGGNGATAVLVAADLKGVLPAAPFLVVGFGPVSGRRQDVRTLFPTVYLYDDEAQRHYRLNALVALVEAAYPEDGIVGCETQLADAGIDREFTDTALNRPALPMRFTLKARF